MVILDGGVRVRVGTGYINGFKKCTICKRYLPLDNFYKNKAKWDGLEAYCHECNRIKANNYYNENKERCRQISYKSLDLYRDRHNARQLSIYFYPIKQLCEVEGCFVLGQRHHNDYSDPHNIRWLCRKHHAELHRNIRKSILAPAIIQ